jgi:MFS family permease
MAAEQEPPPEAKQGRPVPPTSVVEARGAGPNAPRITTHPFVGIVAVFLGLMTQTIYGRLISVGLPDLRGALGAGFDEASWIPTTLNMGVIFIGVFCVFLAAVYGLRRILLISGCILTLTSLLLPFSSTLGVMLALLAVSGLSSGSFYTLTMTFVARSLPPKLLIFGIAAYALDVVATNNLAASIEGFYVEHLSWHWIFWTATILMPLVMVCIGLEYLNPHAGWQRTWIHPGPATAFRCPSWCSPSESVLRAALTPPSASASEARARSVVLLNSQVKAQAYTLASSDAFMLIAWAIVGYLVLLVFLRPSIINLRQAGKPK